MTLSLGRFCFASDIDENGFQFTIKPQLCVLNEGEEICRDQLRVSWQSSIALSPCLYRLDQDESIFCWEKVTRGDYRFNFVASQTTEFELREIQSNHRYGSRRFQVLFSEKKYRRARRNPWSFF